MNNWTDPFIGGALPGKIVSGVIFHLVALTAQAVPLFESDEPIEIRLVGPLHFLKAQRDDNPRWLTGTQVFVKDSDGTERALDVGIKARGNYRRGEHICPFPPYWLNFKKKQLDGTVFEGQWANDLPNGEGRVILLSGESLAGNFVDGVPDGKVVRTMPDGTKSEEVWDEG